MKKYITTHEELLKLNGRLISCSINGNIEDVFKVETEKNAVYFLKSYLFTFINHRYLVSSDQMKIENNKNNVFSKIEIADNKDEQLEVGKEIIKDNEDVIKKLSARGSHFKIECVPEQMVLYIQEVFKVFEFIDEKIQDLRIEYDNGFLILDITTYKGE